MIVDANPIVAACLGRSRPLFDALIANGADLFVPEHQMREARLITYRQAQTRGRDPRAVFTWTDQALSVVPGEVYLAFEAEARERLHTTNAKDWPLVALALTSGDDIWSNDVDLFGVGIAIWNTHNIRRTVTRVSTTPAGENGD